MNRLMMSTGKLHIGCGDVRLPGFLNVDYRPLASTDIIHDCSNLEYFPKNSFSLIYTNAFLEHLYLSQRQTCVNGMLQLLKPDGSALILGIPDFYNVANAYIHKKKGIVSATFDLYNVYRYTHGDPEQYPDWWMEQLHKSLFDEETLVEILKKAKFPAYCIFTYCFRREKIPVSLGCIAWKKSRKRDLDKKWLRNLLTEVSSGINVSTIKVLRCRL